MDKRCISCGMPLTKAEDYANSDTTREYCRHCARTDGTMKSRAEVHDGMTAFLVRTQGLAEPAARKAAADMMSHQPAWKARAGA